MLVQSLGREDPLEEEMATHASTLAWKIPWTEKPGRLQSTGSQRVGHDWATSLSFLEEEMATHSRTLAWKAPWTEKPGGLQSMGSKKSWIWLRVVGSLKCLCMTPLNTNATEQQQLCWLSGETSRPLHRILWTYLKLKYIIFKNYIKINYQIFNYQKNKAVL